jgi:hypothetical protein
MSNMENDLPSIDVSSNSPSSTGKNTLFRPVREWVGVLGAAAGLFAALLYLAGRSYISGYFGAMNFPDYMVSFSLQEYSFFAWLPMFAYPIFVLAFGGLVWGVFYTLRDWLSPWFTRLINWIIKILKWKPPTIRLPKLPRDAHLMFGLFGTGIFFSILILFVSSTLTVVRQIGEIDGKAALLEKSMFVDLISTMPVLSETVNVVTGQEGTFYIYKGFRLLHINNGKYYLFKEIDSVTCKPRQVYIVNSDQFKQVNLTPATSLKNSCFQGQIP